MNLLFQTMKAQQAAPSSSQPGTDTFLPGHFCRGCSPGFSFPDHARYGHPGRQERQTKAAGALLAPHPSSWHWHHTCLQLWQQAHERGRAPARQKQLAPELLEGERDFICLAAMEKTLLLEHSPMPSQKSIQITSPSHGLLWLSPTSEPDGA